MRVFVSSPRIEGPKHPHHFSHGINQDVNLGIKTVETIGVVVEGGTDQLQLTANVTYVVTEPLNHRDPVFQLRHAIGHVNTLHSADEGQQPQLGFGTSIMLSRVIEELGRFGNDN